MTENKRFIIIQDGDYFTVIDNIKNRLMGMFEFKEDEFPVYFCFHKIIDLLNELADEKEYYQVKSGKCEEELLQLRRDNEQLRKENKELKKDLEYYKTERKALFEYIDKKDDLKLELKCGDLND